MEQSDVEQAADLDLRTPDVMNKYQGAGDIVNQALAAVIAATAPGKFVHELCTVGDNTMNEAMAAVFTKGKIEKGIAFPTCVSINGCVGHFSPLQGDTQTIAEGDVVKIDLGVHIDGFAVSGAHTVIATANPQEVISGRKADVICAAYFAAEAALRLFRPGGTNTQITQMIQKIADVFKCSPVEGVLSHQTKRYIMDGGNVIINKETPEHQVDEVTFAEYDVYCFDVIMSTGEGKVKEKDIKTTVFKRAVEQNYNLKMQAARSTFSEINRKYPTMPFSLRAFSDPKRARLAMTEILKHELVDPFPILFEKDGEYVAQFKFTVLLTPAQTLKLISQPLPFVKSDYQITDPQINQLLAQGTKRGAKKKKSNKKKKGGKKAAAPAAAEGAAAEETPKTE